MLAGLAVFSGLAPAIGHAQAVTLNDLRGDWSKQGQAAVYLTITDSTYTVPVLTARWHLTGDTLVTDTLLRSTTRNTPADLRRVIKLQGNQMTLTDPANGQSRVYVRSGTPSAAPAPASGPVDTAPVKKTDCNTLLSGLFAQAQKEAAARKQAAPGDSTPVAITAPIPSLDALKCVMGR
jgi:hypothetical protein